MIDRWYNHPMREEEKNVAPQVTETQAEKSKAPIWEITATYLIALAVLLSDLVTKLLIENRLPLNESYVPFEKLEPIFKITHVSNTGAAFGLFPSGSTIIMVIAVIVSVVIVIYNQRLSASHKLYRIALGLQLGGALGNLLSRFRIGHVTDFLDFGPWPVSNIADISIVSGTILLGLLMLLEKDGGIIVGAEEPRANEQDDEALEQSDEAPMIWNE